MKTVLPDAPDVVPHDFPYSSEPLSHTPGNGVSWPAILAGAVSAVALSLILLMLGQGLGLSSVSVWDAPSDTAITLTAGIAIWLIVMQWLSSAMGGYLAGRLRQRWAGVDADEVFFRDTAQGFLAWCVATTAVEAQKAAGAYVVAFVNDETAPLAALADEVLPLCAGPEKSVAATKSYIASLAAFAALVAEWSDNAALKAGLTALPAQLKTAFDADWSAALPTLTQARNLFVIGRGHDPIRRKQSSYPPPAIEILTARQFIADLADHIDARTHTHDAVAQADHLMVKHRLRAFARHDRADLKRLAAPEAAQEVDLHMAGHQENLIAHHVRKPQTMRLYIFVAGMFHIDEVVGVIDHALRVAFGIAHLERREKDPVVKATGHGMSPA